jgi:subtilisin family serine protease
VNNFKVWDCIKYLLYLGLLNSTRFLFKHHPKIIKMKKHFLVLTILSVAIFTGCKKNSEEVVSNNPSVANEVAYTSPSGQFVPNELLIKFKAGTGEKNRTQTLSLINAKVSEHILTNAMQSSGDNQGVYLVNTPTDVFAAMARMKGESNIEYAEPNWIYNHFADSDDPYYTNGSLWGMYGDATTPANQYGSQAGEAWAAGNTGSNTVFVGVIDEGIQFTHPELDANIWTNPFDPADGLDNDDNGYIDDIHGWDFDGKDNTIYDGGSRGSLDDHGTHVSGTIGAEKNGAGVVGVNWNVKLISGKFLGRRGGTLANAIKAVDYFTDLRTRHNLNIPATNNSWGGGGFSQGLLDAITRAAQAQILFIAAAGNGGSDGVGDDNDVVASYPSNYNTTAGAGYDNVIAVAAITSTGAKSSFSNYGATTVDLGAPGSGVWSTTAFNTYSSYSGTSMATPHVTGAAALYASRNPGVSAAAIKTAILDAARATFTPSLAGKTVTGGRLNVGGF